jgi:tripeptide aminopeptidase
MLRIPAPSFGEAHRAAWFLDRFRQLGLSNAHLDDAGNALAESSATEPGAPGLAPETWGPATNSFADKRPCILISAHLDTVFPAGTPTDPTERESRILGPGSCDNAAGLSGLLALAAAMRHAGIVPPVPFLFAANVGEEGEGDLRGMRHLFDPGASPYAARISAAIALEGSGNSAVVTRALGSRRFRVTVTGPGGHSWTDAGAPNPILILSRALLIAQAAFDFSSAPTADPRTTLNVGNISGGTSINSIPESAFALLDLRSTARSSLDEADAELRQTLSDAVDAPLQLQIDAIGNRPAAELPVSSPLFETVSAVDRHLNLRTEPRLGSTDANIPLSLGVPAIAIGAGGLGGGIHTLREWYDPTGRQIALRRILLILLDTANLASESHSPQS